jgi:hypothetical protein
MARFLLVLQLPPGSAANSVLDSLTTMLAQVDAEIDHRTPAHLSALLKSVGESQRMQLFADLQSKTGGARLELVLLSREGMGTGAPITRQMFERLVGLLEQQLSSLPLVFRSDRDGAVPI